MKKKTITVGDVQVQVPDPTGDQLRLVIATDEDFAYLAKRAWEQALRSFLLRKRKEGMSVRRLEKLASIYEYHRQTRSG